MEEEFAGNASLSSATSYLPSGALSNGLCSETTAGDILSQSTGCGLYVPGYLPVNSVTDEIPSFINSWTTPSGFQDGHVVASNPMEIHQEKYSSFLDADQQTSLLPELNGRNSLICAHIHQFPSGIAPSSNTYIHPRLHQCNEPVQREKSSIRAMTKDRTKNTASREKTTNKNKTRNHKRGKGEDRDQSGQKTLDVQNTQHLATGREPASTCITAKPQPSTSSSPGTPRKASKALGRSEPTKIARPNVYEANTDTAETQRQHRRERNRKAANKCRAKKEAATRKLEAVERSLREQQQTLSTQAAALQSEVWVLKNELMRHHSCDSVPIQQYLKRAVAQTFESSDSARGLPSSGCGAGVVEELVAGAAS